MRKPSKLVALPDTQILGALLHRIVVSVAFLALALPSIGPLLDHHFAERQPDHAHVFRGERVVDHEHPYGLVHTHHSDLPNSAAAQFGDAAGIVYLTSDDAAGPGFIPLSAVSMNPEIDFPGFGDSPLLFRFADTGHSLTESFLLVPKRPPRA